MHPLRTKKDPKNNTPYDGCFKSILISSFFIIWFSFFIIFWASFCFWVYTLSLINLWQDSFYFSALIFRVSLPWLTVASSAAQTCNSMLPVTSSAYTVPLFIYLYLCMYWFFFFMYVCMWNGLCVGEQFSFVAPSGFEDLQL